jgi:hypothetical protein
VYCDHPHTLNELQTAVTVYIRNISPADLQKVFANQIKQVQACINARGHHSNNLYKCTAIFRTHYTSTPCRLSTFLRQPTLNIIRRQCFGVLPYLHLQGRRKKLLLTAAMDAFMRLPSGRHTAGGPGQNKMVSGQTNEPVNYGIRGRCGGIATALSGASYCKY